MLDSFKRILLLVLVAICSSVFSQSADTAIAPLFKAKYAVSKVNINSKDFDFAPLLYNKKMYFVSSRRENIGIVYTNHDTTLHYTDIYSAKQIDSIRFEKPVKMHHVNSVNNDGPISLAKSGNYFVFSTNDKSLKFLYDDNHVNHKLQIYYCEIINGKWSSPKLHPVCNKLNSFCHPSISEDGKTLYFSSDLKGGFGGMDIYRSDFVNGKWTEPVNLGSKVNSSSNELFPSLANNDLYFSSNKVGGYGGMDVYRFRVVKDIVEHLSEPVNSAYDDFGLSANENGDKGYFSSNRDTLFKDDIYYFVDQIPKFDSCVVTDESMCYNFFEESTLASGDTLSTSYEWDFGNGVKKRGLQVDYCFDKPGLYKVDLNVIEKESGEVFYNEMSYELEVTPPLGLIIKAESPLVVREPVTFNAGFSKFENDSILEYWWIFGDTLFAKGTRTKFSFSKKGDYLVKLGAVIQNDSTKVKRMICAEKTIRIGELSDRQAILKLLNVKDDDKHFIYSTEGIDSLRFRVNLGFSKQQLETHTGIFEGVEKVIESKEDSVYRYTSGDEKTLSEIYPYFEKAKQHGFDKAIVIGYNKGKIISDQGDNIRNVLYDAEYVNTNALKVYFKYNVKTFDKKYIGDLDSLIQQIELTKPNSVFIITHFDGIGSLDYNMKLSKKRSDGIIDYLVKRKVDPELIKRQLIINPEENLSPDLARRIELLIVN